MFSPGRGWRFRKCVMFNCSTVPWKAKSWKKWIGNKCSSVRQKRPVVSTPRLTEEECWVRVTAEIQAGTCAAVDSGLWSLPTGSSSGSEKKRNICTQRRIFRFLENWLLSMCYLEYVCVCVCVIVVVTKAPDIKDGIFSSFHTHTNLLIVYLFNFLLFYFGKHPKNI